MTAACDPDLAHAAFCARARLQPDAVAVECGGERLTYAELDRRSTTLARALQRRGIGPEVIVGLGVDRSLAMPVGLLGILQAGGAYLPLDPDHPRERLATMLADARASVLVTQDHLRERFAFPDARVLRLDADWPAIAQDGGSLRRTVAARNLAYVIYTSGSTGRPKGVLIEHRSVSNVMRAFAARIGLAPHDIWLAITTLSFDIACLEILGPLSVGARLALAPREAVTDVDRLVTLLHDTRSTVLQATPVAWRSLVDTGWRNPALRGLCGGEAFSWRLAQQLLEATDAAWNVYGPTETTIWSTCHPLAARDGDVLMGEAIDRTQVLVVDAADRPIARGETGELSLGGIGVARGYTNAALTATRFVPHACSAEPGARVYRTGDRVRLRAHGGLEYVGRGDRQIKLRGVRLELGEIEAQLRRLAGVREAAVVLQQDERGNAHLAAYVGLAAADSGWERRLRASLAEMLPVAFQPARWHALDEWPLTANGKIDRLALAQRIESMLPAAVFVPPSTETARILAGLWSDQLNLPQPGIDADFFELGGHSLLATRILAQLRVRLGVTLTLDQFLERPTIRALSAMIDEASIESAPDVAR
jgi:amino acid adenylation domain-containing protein